MKSNTPLSHTSAQGPVREEELITGSPSHTAGGVKAVLESLRHGVSEMGLGRTAFTLLKVNQPNGFDCPGCAWPEPEHRSTFEFCENGAKAVAEEATVKRVSKEFFKKHAVAELGEWTDYELGRSGRLTHPMLLEPGASHYVPLSWDSAFQIIKDELTALKNPNDAIFYTSGRTSNEAAFLYQLFVRKFGTNNLPDCSNMCHESSGTGMSEAIGIGKGTVTLEDFNHAGAIFVIGQNPGTNHPRMLSALREAKKRGTQIVTINPLIEVGLQRFSHPQKPSDLLLGGTDLTDLYLQVRINGDVAALKGIIKALLEAEAQEEGSVLDLSFVQNKTRGFEDFRQDVLNTSWDEVTSQSGLTEPQLRDAASIYQKANGVIVCWAMGLTQHVNGVANVQSAINLLLLGGNIGRPGAGACPVRGHSNVQGDRTMGIWEKPPSAFLDRLGELFHFTPPRDHGFSVVPAIEAMAKQEGKVVFALGGNFLSATPDTEYTAKALQRCQLTVQVSTKLNRSHLVTGKRALILPCLGRTEVDIQESGAQFVTVENSMGVVHSSRGNLPPASPLLRSEPAIIAGIAHQILGDSPNLNWSTLTQNYDRVRDLIARTIPGFENFNTRVRHQNGFALPNGPRERSFPTPDGKALFTVHPIPGTSVPPGHLMMMTIRSHDQYNTTIYGLEDRYRGIQNGRRVIFMNHDDIHHNDLRPGQAVDLHNTFGDRQRVAERFTIVPYDIPRGCAATYFPEANVLVPINKVAHRSGTPASKAVVIRVEPSRQS